jgi:hypothetical protein
MVDLGTDWKKVIRDSHEADTGDAGVLDGANELASSDAVVESESMLGNLPRELTRNDAAV